jgi:hemin uptake protein HemP
MLSTDSSNAKPAFGQPCVVPKTPASEPRPPVFSSVELLQGGREAWIEHGEQMYRLRLTAAGKLYLTK